MSGPAQVRSTESIDAFQAALARFQQRVTAALDALDAEIRRAGDWVDHDRPSYWKKATHEAEDAVHQAKLELERCRMFTVDGQRPACREQEAAYKAAQVRCTYCRDKVEVVRKWQRNYRHESIEYSGRVGQLRRALEQDVPNARLLLVKILRRLEEYQLERPPEAMDTPAATQTTPLESRTQTPAPVATPTPAPAHKTNLSTASPEPS
jgi:hypothetical protein